MVNPRTPSVLPATRRNFRSYGGGNNNNNNRAFNSRSGEYSSREARNNEEIFSSNDAIGGSSFQHQIYDMNQNLQVRNILYHALKKKDHIPVKTPASTGSKITPINYIFCSFSLQNNPYYQSYQNHRVKRHEEDMKKSNLGEVKTNSTFLVIILILHNFIYKSINFLVKVKFSLKNQQQLVH